jgi:long-chain acyl-CoA synthetase
MTVLTSSLRARDSGRGNPRLIISNKFFEPSALDQAINSRLQTIADPLAITFDPAFSVEEQVISGLARLAAGFPIVGTTSGSTGMAKKYKRTQDSWLASFAADQQEFKLNNRDVIIAPGSLQHSMFSYALCHGLHIGAMVVLSESFRPGRVLEQIEQHQGTVLYGVPTQLKLIAQQAGSNTSSKTFPSVRWILSSGARWFLEILPQLKQTFPNASIAEFYGASELSYVSLALHTSDSNLPQGSVGRLFHGTQIQIESANERAGKIWVHSQGLFDSYIGEAPSDFSEKADADGKRWCSVGDLGWINEQGYLFLTGRESRKLVVSGKNLYPEEVEQLLLGHPRIEEAAVLGVPDDLRGERLVAAVKFSLNEVGATGRVDQDCVAASAELIAFLKPLVEDFKLPRHYVAINDWPRTATGKTDFSALQGLVTKHMQAKHESIA